MRTSSGDSPGSSARTTSCPFRSSISTAGAQSILRPPRCRPPRAPAAGGVWGCDCDPREDDEGSVLFSGMVDLLGVRRATATCGATRKARRALLPREANWNTSEYSSKLAAPPWGAPWFHEGHARRHGCDREAPASSTVPPSGSSVRMAVPVTRALLSAGRGCLLASRRQPSQPVALRMASVGPPLRVPCGTQECWRGGRIRHDLAGGPAGSRRARPPRSLAPALRAAVLLRAFLRLPAPCL